MNANQISQIATSLNVSPNQIKRAEEWANVLFVVVQGKGARFVSKKVVSMTQLISGLEFAQKLQTLWNQSKGSEWNKLAGGFVKARLWDKKADEIRVYFGDGYFSIKEIGGEFKAGYFGFKYGIQAEVVTLIKVLKEDFKLASLKPEKVKVLRNEDGEEVEENDPDGVVYA
jgi:hypothetical protein